MIELRRNQGLRSTGRCGWVLVCLLFVVAALTACGHEKAAPVDTPRRVVATIEPLGMILRELTEGRADVVVLLKPGSSPHTYDPKPSDVELLTNAGALFMVATNLDGWASKLPAGRTIEVIGLINEQRLIHLDAEDSDHAHDHDHDHGHDHGDIDPHIWLDPLLVQEAIPALVAELSALDPEGRAVYTANGDRFSMELDALDAELRMKLDVYKGRRVLLQHPSFLYFLKQYGLEYSGAIETAPGKEPTPVYIKSLVDRIAKEKISAIFTEPQLSNKAASVIAEAAKIPVHELDPIGGAQGRRTYEDLLVYNAEQLAKAYGK